MARETESPARATRQHPDDAPILRDRLGLPVGLAYAWVLVAALLVLTLRRPDVRWWIVLSLAALIAEGLPVHSAEYLRQVAGEFESVHWISRMAFNTVAAVAAFAGFLRLYRNRPLACG